MDYNPSRTLGRINTCLVFFVTTLFSYQVYAGAWVHAPNKAYVEMNFSFYQSNEFFNFNGDKRRIILVQDPTDPSSIFAGTFPSTYRQMEGNLYVEYGLVKNLETNLSFPFLVSARQDSTLGLYGVTGIGDLIWGFKYKYFENGWIVLAGGLDFGFPTGNSDAQGTSPGKNPQPIPLGDGEWDYAIRAFASHSFSPVNAYISADIGYRIRTSNSHFDYPDDIPWNLDGGYTFEIGENWFPTLTATLAFRGLLATKNTGISTLISLNASGLVPGQEYIDVQPGISLNIYNRWSWNSSASYTITGKNTGAGWTYRTGVAWEN